MNRLQIQKYIDQTEDAAKRGKLEALQALPLWEIALQLAVQNEQAQKRHEENIQQRDAFLLTDPEPSKTNPFGERGEWHQGEALEIADELLNTIGHSSSRERDKRAIALEMQQYALRFALARQPFNGTAATAAVLRRCALTIQENDLDRIKAVDYLMVYADKIERRPHAPRCPGTSRS